MAVDIRFVLLGFNDPREATNIKESYTMQSLTERGNPTARVIHSQDVPVNKMPANTFYVDAGSIWANPFVTSVHGTAAECLDKYRTMLAMSPDVLEEIDQLKGMNLLCHNKAHAEVLLHLAAMNYRQRLDWAAVILGTKKAFSLAA